MIKKLRYKILIFIVILQLFIIFKFLKSNNKEANNPKNSKKSKSYIEVFSSDKNEYKKFCLKLYDKKRTINSSLVFRPPLKQPPNDILDDFQQNGDMPILKSYYFNEAYLDSDLKNNKINEHISEKTISDILYKIRLNESFNQYLDKELKELFLSHRYFRNSIVNKSMAIFGTQIMWIEALSFEAGCSKIFTFDYTRKTSFNPDKFIWYHMIDYLNIAIRDNLFENFDNAASFSSFG